MLEEVLELGGECGGGAGEEVWWGGGRGVELI